MKTRLLAILTATGIVAIIIPAALFFLPSLVPGTYQFAESTGPDLSNPSTDNPLGIRVQVVIEPDMSVMCPTRCTIPPTPHLVLSSEKGAQFIGYQVCDGDSCKKDKIDDAPYVSMNSIPQSYTGPAALHASPINLGNLPWKAGDLVHVIVKALPVTLEPNDVLVRDPLKTAVVDLGESKIVQYDVTTNQNQNASWLPPFAGISKIVDVAHLNQTLAGRPISKTFGVLFGQFDWSNDGKFVVFSSNTGNTPSYLWVMSPDGKDTGIINVPNIESIYKPRVSPNDKSVYFIGGYPQNGTWHQDIYNCPLDNDSNSCQDLTRDSKIGAFDFTPQGTGLIFVEEHSTTTPVRSMTFLVRHYNMLWLSDLEGKKRELLFNGTQPFSDLSMSPDGNSVAFFDRDNPIHPADNGTYLEYSFPGGGLQGPKPVYLALFDIAQKNFTVLDNSTDYVYGNFGWTGDGRYIVADKLFSSEMAEVGPDAFVGAGAVTLIPISEPQNQTVLYGNSAEPYMPTPEGLAVSPDQKSLVFGIDADYYGNKIDGKGIYRLDLANPLP